MESVVDDKIIRKLLKSNNIEDRISVVKDLKYKVKDLEVLVDIIDELFEVETNGEVIYWCVELLENIEESEEVYKRAKTIVYKKLDEDADKRRETYLKGNLVPIESGKFMMGGSRYEREKPIHEVKLSEFYMTKFLITNELYEKFDPKHRNKRDEYSDEDNQPVIYVNWYEAFIFSRWIGCELPKEAQWEYACRAGTKTEHNNGNGLKENQANFNENKTTLVGKYKPSKWGLYDMHGNVYEWCKDWYDESYYTKCEKENIINNPENEEEGADRVLRGGSWCDYSEDCRSAFRDRGDPDDRLNYVGFRLCSTV
jgi:formylglycine-generating enzyme required for sulfatase activity